MMVTLALTFHETLFLEASMSEPNATATPFVGSDRRSEILDRLAETARATPPATTPQAIASRVAASIQNQMQVPPKEADEDEGGERVKPRDKDNKDSADRKGHLDGRRPGKEEKDDKDDKDDPDKQATEKSGDKDIQDAKDTKDAKDDKDVKDKEASDKSGDKDVIDNKNDKDVKDVNDKDKDTSDKGDDKEGDKEGDKETSDKGDDTGTGTFTDDEFVDPASHGQLAETSADKPPAGGIGRPTSLLTGLPVV
jgi:hypothetical protein